MASLIGGFTVLWVVAVFSLSSMAVGDLQSLYGRHVVARFHSGDEGHAQAAVAAVDELAEKLSQEFGVALTERAEIILCSSRPEFDRVIGKPQPAWVIGVADSERNRIMIRRGTVKGIPSVVRHELVHILLAKALGPAAERAPQWLHEGAAKYYGGDWSAADGAALAEAAKGGRLHSLRQLGHFPTHPESSAVAYAESYVLVEYLVSLEPAHGLKEFISEFRLTQDQGRAFLRAYGLTEAEIEAGWRQAIMKKVRSVPTDWAAETVGFLLIVAVFGIAYVRVRRRAREIRRRMEMEEGFTRLSDQWLDDQR